MRETIIPQLQRSVDLFAYPSHLFSTTRGSPQRKCTRRRKKNGKSNRASRDNIEDAMRRKDILRKYQTEKSFFLPSINARSKVNVRV